MPQLAVDGRPRESVCQPVGAPRRPEVGSSARDRVAMTVHLAEHAAVSGEPFRNEEEQEEDQQEHQQCADH